PCRTRSCASLILPSRLGPIGCAIPDVQHSLDNLPSLSFRGSITRPLTWPLCFAGWVAPPPRRTRFWLLARLCQAGLDTRRVPAKGFRVRVSSSFPQALGFLGARTLRTRPSPHGTIEAPGPGGVPRPGPRRAPMDLHPDGSVTHWPGALKAGDDAAAQRLWERYFDGLVRLARAKLGAKPRSAADKEGVALSAFHSFCQGAGRGRFPRLDDR